MYLTRTEFVLPLKPRLNLSPDACIVPFPLAVLHFLVLTHPPSCRNVRVVVFLTGVLSLLLSPSLSLHPSLSLSISRTLVRYAAIWTHPPPTHRLQAAGIKQVISSAQLKLSVLAQSCLCPGWSAVVANLLESRAAIPPAVCGPDVDSVLSPHALEHSRTIYEVVRAPLCSAFVYAPLESFGRLMLFRVHFVVGRLRETSSAFLRSPIARFSAANGETVQVTPAHSRGVSFDFVVIRLSMSKKGSGLPSGRNGQYLIRSMDVCVACLTQLLRTEGDLPRPSSTK